MAWYYPHDYKFRYEPAMIELVSEFGIIGYAWWHITLELMGQFGGIMPKCKVNVFASACQNGFGEFQAFIDGCLSIGLLTDHGDYYENEWFSEQYQKSVSKSEKSRNAAMRMHGNKSIEVPEPTSPPETGLVEKPAKKAKEKPDDIPEDEDIAVVKSAIQAMLKHGDNVSGLLSGNKKSTLTNAEIRKLIDRYGIDLLLLMIDEFYLWKLPYSKVIKSDYMSIIKGWVEENARKKLKDKPTKKGLF